ncbi:VanZ family protein [Agromyces endophyticus]|uniref:VanZ family protein n=1 Tax=Agromyces sp. H17E-10 TaxID=2932244 RepID=UPI001FD22AA0|nr:VanZ family protein [Agromyces sp. H17E-10]UOQ88101.1 VanZ family protein [Agromyces sp. H17E-10]
MDRRPLGLVAAAYAAIVLWVTIGPAPWRTASHQVDGGILNPDAWTASVTWTTGYLAEIAFNVALFIPVGALAALLLPRRFWPLAMLAGFSFATMIELIQLPEPDRISDPRDLVMNTAGTIVGVVLVQTARMVRRAGAVAATEVLSPTEAIDAAVATGTLDPLFPGDAVGARPAPQHHEPALAAMGSSADRAA